MFHTCYTSKLKNGVRNVLRAYKQQLRTVSVLYVSGDKAKDNYPPLQPYMDYDGTLSNTESLKENIAQRRIAINVDKTLEKYRKYLDGQSEIQRVEKKRKDIANTIKDLNTENVADSESDLKAMGKQLKIELKQLRERFSPIEDDFIQEFLELPNTLHEACPSDEHEKLIYRSSINKTEKLETHLKRKDLIKYLNNTSYYLMDEAAEFDVNCTFALSTRFVRQSFIPTANPDFVRRVLLEANATPVEQYHVVVERQLQNKFNEAHLAGGASFESFLGALARLCVYPNVLPFRMVSTGRIYCKVCPLPGEEENLFTATQSNAVSTFVASETAVEADQEMESILNIVVDFYKQLDIPFQIIYLPAYKLTAAERLRAVIEVYSPAQQRYICVGHVSNYGDWVSKRILFTVRNKENSSFLYLVGGPVLYTTRLIAALIEHNVTLDHDKLLAVADSEPQQAMKDFKNLFS